MSGQSGTFQQYVPTQPAPGKPGDFAGVNPRMSARGPALGWQAAPDFPSAFGGATQPAVKIGSFAWGVATNGDPTVAGVAASYYQPNAVLGFVHGEQQGLLTQFLQPNLLACQAGYPAYMMSRGEFWASFPAGATRGQKVYADPVTGAPSAGAAGAGVQFAITASLSAAGVLNVTVTGGVLATGQAITGANVPAGTFITGQLTGGAGGVGTYQCNQGAVVASEGMTATGLIETPFYVSQGVPVNAAFSGNIAAQTGVLTVDAVTTGQIAVGQFLQWNGMAATQPVQITALLTGNGGAGSTYQTSYTNRAAVADPTNFTASQGTMAKISTWQAD